MADIGIRDRVRGTEEELEFFSDAIHFSTRKKEKNKSAMIEVIKTYFDYGNFKNSVNITSQ